jgi:hypothetical protein
VIWNKQLGDYTLPATSATAAPLIAKGKLITGNSGGEFGVVGAHRRARRRTPASWSGTARRD